MINNSIDFNSGESLNEQLHNLLYNIDDTELILIKCHLLIEFSLNSYLERLSKNRVRIDKQNFSFSQKIKIRKLFGLFDADHILEEFIVNLNKLRNEIAHTLSYDKTNLEKLCLYEGGENRDSFIKDQLKGLTLFHTGRIIGKSFAHTQGPPRNNSDLNKI